MTEPRRSGLRWRFGARLIVVLVAIALAPPAAAELKVDITRGNVEPLRIAIPNFAAGAPASAEHGRNVAEVVAADLERSGLFRPVDQRAFICPSVNR